MWDETAFRKTLIEHTAAAPIRKDEDSKLSSWRLRINRNLPWSDALAPYVADFARHLGYLPSNIIGAKSKPAIELARAARAHATLDDDAIYTDSKVVVSTYLAKGRDIIELLEHREFDRAIVLADLSLFANGKNVRVRQHIEDHGVPVHPMISDVDAFVHDLYALHEARIRNPRWIG